MLSFHEFHQSVQDLHRHRPLVGSECEKYEIKEEDGQENINILDLKRSLSGSPNDLVEYDDYSECVEPNVPSSKSDSDEEYVPKTKTTSPKTRNASSSKSNSDEEYVPKTKTTLPKTRTKSKQSSINSEPYQAGKSKRPPLEPKTKSEKPKSVPDVEIAEYFDMKCDLCDFRFRSMKDASQHHRRQHKQNGYLVCCGRKFRSLVKVKEHCEWHRDPTMFE